mgnify:CR=1 FL=1
MFSSGTTMEVTDDGPSGREQFGDSITYGRIEPPPQAVSKAKIAGADSLNNTVDGFNYFHPLPVLMEIMKLLVIQAARAGRL